MNVVITMKKYVIVMTVIASVPAMFEETTQNQDDQSVDTTETSPKQLEPHAEERLREKLNLF